MSTARHDRAEVPPRARTAAILFLTYAVLVLLNVLVWHLGAATSTPTELFRAGVRILGVVLIAIGLLRGARWAWMAGVVFAGLWLLLGVLAAAALFAGAAGSAVSVSTILVIAAIGVLAGGWGLLLTGEVRHAYRSR